MSKFIATIKAIITRIVFAAHGFVAVWQVTIFKKNYFYWYLSSPILLLFFEGIFTLTIKKTQEWKWFCPSVFLYLLSTVPAIWLLELDKVDRRLKTQENHNFTSVAGNNIKEINNLIGVQIRLPEISLSTETWITLIEQFLMLILIIGRWMLPKGDLTRDQLSQLLLVYIGTAADIIEFFDSFKDDKIAGEPLLVLLTLGIWSWSLMQFTVVLTATKSRKSRLSSTGTIAKSESHKQQQQKKNNFELTNISIISKPEMYETRKRSPCKKRGKRERSKKNDKRRYRSENEISEDDAFSENEMKNKKVRKLQNSRKDTGYSTGSSHTSTRNNLEKSRLKKPTRESTRTTSKTYESKTKQLKRNHGKQRQPLNVDDVFSEESDVSILSEYETKAETKKVTPKRSHGKEKKKYEKETTISISTSDASSE